MEWCLLNELTLFKRLDLKFPVSSVEFLKPKRIPAQAQTQDSPEENLHNMESHYLEDYVAIFQNQIDKLLDNNMGLVDENIKLKVEKNETKAEYEMLKFQRNLEVQKLAHENKSLNQQLADQDQLVEKQREELRKIKLSHHEQVEEQSQKLNELFEMQKDLSVKIHELSQNVANKEKLIIKLEERISQLQKQNKEQKTKYTQEFDEMQSSYEGKIKQLINNYEVSLSEMKTDKEKQVLELTQNHSLEMEATLTNYQEQVKQLKLELELKNHQSQKQGGVASASQVDEEEIKRIIAEKDKRINQLLSTQEKIKTKYKEDFEKAQKTFENYKQVINVQKSKEKQFRAKEEELNNNVIQLNNNLRQANDDLEQERIKSQRLELLMEQQAVLNEIADEKIKVQDEFVAFKELGKLFEISNAPHWEVRHDSYKDEKFTLKELREMLSENKISQETFVKREGKWWKKAKEVHELFLELREKVEGGKTRYYIERQSLRVPCGDKVDVLTDKAEFSGACVNISTGGCLILVPELNKHAFKEDHEITIVFKSESLLFEFEIVGTIRNVDEKDKSLGIQFVDITDEEYDTISFYIDSFVDKVEEEAA